MRTLPLLLLLACEPPPPGDGTAVPLPPGHLQEPDTWAVAPGQVPAHGRVFTAALTEAAEAHVTCERVADPAERHVLEAPSAREHRIALLGLLPDEAYACTLQAGGVSSEITFQTAPPPAWVPEWTVHGTSTGDYLLLNHSLGGEGGANQQKLLIIDRDGGLRWSMRAPKAVPDLDAQYIPASRTLLYGGGHGIVPTIVDMEQEVIWEGPPASTGRAYHHHTEWLDMGQVLTLAHADDSFGGQVWDGFTIERIDPVTNELTWRWASQSAVDTGRLPIPPPDKDDPYHANSVQWLGDKVVVNLYIQSYLLAIDTDSKEVLWKLGRDQDFQLLDADGEPAPQEAWFYRAHANEHEGDRVLLYDNGVGRPGGSYSRALELEIDEEARTARIVWEWTEPGWYEAIWGDVDRLPSGNVLVTKAHCVFCSNADPDERTEIVEVHRDEGVVWRLTFTDGIDAGYRSQLIDGCDLFANQRYCP